MVAGYETPYSLTSLQKPFRKDGTLFIEVEVTDWDAGAFEPLLDDINNHGRVVHMRFEELQPAAEPAVAAPAEEESGDPDVAVPAPS